MDPAISSSLYENKHPATSQNWFWTFKTSQLANKLMMFAGSGRYALYLLSSFGRVLVLQYSQNTQWKKIGIWGRCVWLKFYDQSCWSLHCNWYFLSLHLVIHCNWNGKFYIHIYRIFKKILKLPYQIKGDNL